MVTTWLLFVACACVIGAAGIRLSILGDRIAQQTGLSAHWVSMILTVDDTVYQAAPLFERLSGAHIVSASMALAMTSITWLAARDNPETRTKWGRWSRPGTALCAGYLIHVGTQLILMQRPPS